MNRWPRALPGAGSRGPHRRPGAGPLSRPCPGPGLRGGAPGFTLVEILVALAVVAIAMGAMVRVMGDSARTAERLEERTLGHRVAMNDLALLEATGVWLEPGVSSGSAEMAGRRWRWRRTVRETPEPRVRRVEVEVSNSAGEPVAWLVGFIGQGR